MTLVYLSSAVFNPVHLTLFDEHLRPFYMGVPSRVSLLQANHESELIKQLLLLPSPPASSPPPHEIDP